MAKQTIIAIAREYGSEGHTIGKELAEKLGVKLYDRSLLDEMADNMGIKVEVLEKHDEKPRNMFLSRRVGPYTNSMEEIVAEMQFDFIREKAESGESFVIVGRCADSVLQGTEGLITVYVTGTKEAKVKHVREKFQLSEAEALMKMARHDKTRRQYYNRHSDREWGDVRNYDVCINSSFLGVKDTADVLETYVRKRMEK